MLGKNAIEFGVFIEMGNEIDSPINQNDLITDLQHFDLSKEEAEIYLCLLKNKVMTVREINQSIPYIQRTYLYNFLDKMNNNEWVHINQATKPQTFNPIPPGEILAKKLKQKRAILLQQLEEINHLEKTVLPKLLKQLNTIHQQNSLKHVPVQYQPIITEFFENNPSIRIEYINRSSNINPYLNFFFVSCTFHGFFISWHKKPISDEYSIHFYEFEQPITKTHLELANNILELQGNEMMTLLTEREGIYETKTIAENSTKIDGVEVTQVTISYKKEGTEYHALITHPWKLNKNTIAFFYANQKEKGLKLLEWIIKKIK